MVVDLELGLWVIRVQALKCEPPVQWPSCWVGAEVEGVGLVSHWRHAWQIKRKQHMSHPCASKSHPQKSQWESRPGLRLESLFPGTTCIYFRTDPQNLI